MDPPSSCYRKEPPSGLLDAPSSSFPMTCPSTLRSTPQGLKTAPPECPIESDNNVSGDTLSHCPTSNCSRRVYQPSTNAQPKRLRLPNLNSLQIPPLELDEIRAIWGTTVSFQSIVWSTVAPDRAAIFKIAVRN